MPERRSSERVRSQSPAKPSSQSRNTTPITTPVKSISPPRKSRSATPIDAASEERRSIRLSPAPRPDDHPAPISFDETSPLTIDESEQPDGR